MYYFSIQISSNFPYILQPEDEEENSLSHHSDDPHSLSIEENSRPSSRSRKKIVIKVSDKSSDELSENKQTKFIVDFDQSEYDIDAISKQSLLSRISEWDYPVFQLHQHLNNHLLSQVK